MVEGYGMKASGKEAASGILLIVVLIIGLVLILPWLLKKLITSTASNAAETTKELLAIPSKAIEERQKEQNFIISNKIKAAQAAYNVQPYRDENGNIQTLNEWVEGRGMVEEIVTKGIEILPYGGDFLAREGKAGAEFAKDLAESDDRQRYEELNPIVKTYVNIGEGLSRTIGGFSPYKAGQDFGSWLGIR